MLAKEKTWKNLFNTNSELLQNRTERQIMVPKTTINWLFNDIWCYLFIACFDWKIGVFQQTVVRVYYVVNISSFYCYRGTSTILNLNINFICPFSKLFIFLLLWFYSIQLFLTPPVFTKGSNALKRFCRLLPKCIWLSRKIKSPRGLQWD